MSNPSEALEIGTGYVDRITFWFRTRREFMQMMVKVWVRSFLTDATVTVPHHTGAFQGEEPR